jgi:hypothetical protein
MNLIAARFCFDALIVLAFYAPAKSFSIWLGARARARDRLRATKN